MSRDSYANTPHRHLTIACLDHQIYPRFSFGSVLIQDTLVSFECIGEKYVIIFYGLKYPIEKKIMLH